MKKAVYSVFAALSLMAGDCLASADESDSLWFPVGEKLKYKVYWGIVPVGIVEVSSEWVEVEGMNFILLRARNRSNSVIAKIYPVDDIIESYVEPLDFLPYKYMQDLKEGKHIRKDLVTFDWDMLAAFRYNDSGVLTKTLKINKNTRDVLCLLYAMRKDGMEPKEQKKYDVVVDDKVYDLIISAIKSEEIDVGDYGEMETLYVEPKATFGQIFVRKGKVFAWFSRDSRHICVKMIGKVPVANIRVNLVKVSGPGDDKWVKEPAKEPAPDPDEDDTEWGSN